MLIDSTNIQFKEYSQGMDSLFPSRLDENISSDAPVRLANQLVDEFDISLLLSCLLYTSFYRNMLFGCVLGCVEISGMQSDVVFQAELADK